MYDIHQQIARAARADSLSLAGGDTVHDQWALHSFALEQGNGWLPVKLRRYHKNRKINGELMEGYYDEFIPVAYDTASGQMVKKEVTEETAVCPECDVEARRWNGDNTCPECGLVVHNKGPSAEIIRDTKTAGRVDTSSDYYG